MKWNEISGVKEEKRGRYGLAVVENCPRCHLGQSASIQSFLTSTLINQKTLIAQAYLSPPLPNPASSFKYSIKITEARALFLVEEPPSRTVRARGILCKLRNFESMTYWSNSFSPIISGPKREGARERAVGNHQDGRFC